MNSNSIHVYEDYAVAPNGKPNNNGFVVPENVVRIKVVRVFDEQEFGKTRMTGYVDALRCDQESGQPYSMDNGQFFKYRARDVISDWDEYEDAAQQYAYEAELAQKEREDRWRREEEIREAGRRQREQNRLDQEAAQRKLQEERDATKARLLVQLAERGINIDHVTLDPRFNQATITLEELRRWLDSLEKQTCETCDRTFMIIRSPFEAKDNLEPVN